MIRNAGSAAAAAAATTTRSFGPLLRPGATRPSCKRVFHAVVPSTAAAFGTESRARRRGPYDGSSLLTYDRHYVDGAWIRADGTSSIDVTDSNTGALYARVADGSPSDTSRVAVAASKAFLDWSAVPPNERIDRVRAVVEASVRRKEDIGEVLQRELGAPAKFAKNVQAGMLGYQGNEFLSIAEGYQWSQDIGRGATVAKEPAGVVAAITPWNWPCNQIAMKVFPALLAGCTVILKPSEVAPINAVLFAEAVHDSKALPPGVFNLLLGGGSTTGESLVSHQSVDMVSFTGSTNVGKRLHALGSDTLKRVRTELGGKGAAIVLPDATEAHVRMAASQVLGNSGQTCNALTRLLVPAERHDESVGIAKEAFESVRAVEATDPSAKRGDVGPLASAVQLKRVRSYIRKGVEEGATLVTGGVEPPPDVPRSGYFVRPTLFANADNSMTIAREEIFGPVLSVIPYDTVEGAVSIANDTMYGLGNAVFGRDDKQCERVALRLRSGEVLINCTHSANPAAPFGGYKCSGDGRECGVWGLEEFMQIKSVIRSA